MLVTGPGIEHARLKEELAAFKGRARALLFSTGYMANIGVVTASRAAASSCCSIALATLRSLTARCCRSRLQALRSTRKPTPPSATPPRDRKGRVVATDGVVSRDGDVSPLRELIKPPRHTARWFGVDDANGSVLLGATGRGSLEHLRVELG